jgi:hypothetical protein
MDIEARRTALSSTFLMQFIGSFELDYITSASQSAADP